MLENEVASYETITMRQLRLFSKTFEEMHSNEAELG